MKKTKIDADVTVKNKKNSSVIGTFKGKSADIVANNNSMLLDRPLWENLINSDEFKRYRDLGHYIGFLGHPEDPGCQDFEHACIVLRDLEINEDGEVWGTFDLIDTPVGRIVKAFIDAGVQFGISVRGAGDVAADGYVDPDSFVFRGFDLVSFPAYDDAIPTFEQIAASSDPKNVKKYEAVVSTLHDNLDKISSATTLDVIKEQLNPKSDQYKEVEARCGELDSMEDEDVKSQKIKAMTQMYLDQVKANRDLKKQLNSTKQKLSASRKTCSTLRKVMSSSQRIMSKQLARIQASSERASAKYLTAVRASTQLKSELFDANTQNLNYVQKVNASDATIAEKDKVIASLRSDIRKTVAKSDRQRQKVSDFDSRIADLNEQIEASQKIIADYQDAYASLYATAIGANLENISVTASTSVDELKDIIRCSTSTSNIPTMPYVDDAEEVDIVDPDTTGNGIATL